MDEPNSYLDDKNEMNIMSILSDLKDDMYIIIATHDKRIVDACDIVYLIKDKKLHLDKGVITKDDLLITDNNVKQDENKKQIIKACSKALKEKSSTSFNIMLIVLILFFNFSILFQNIYQDYVADHYLNSSTQEIRLYYGGYKQKVYQDLYSELSKEALNKISKIDGIKEVVPFYEIPATLGDSEIYIQTYKSNFYK